VIDLATLYAAVDFGLRCIAIVAFIFAACVALSIVLGWIDDAITKGMNE
jgi:hypothetical protein